VTETVQTIRRYHDFSAGHRVVGHENVCARIHGHNYRVRFECAADSLDALGRVIDFSVVKHLLCNWLEENWDHRFLVYKEDPLLVGLHELDPGSIVVVPFNPTAENMATFLLEEIGPKQLSGTGVVLTRVEVEETRKCSAIAVRR
jgi:6-pyruvoyltetrahydropterin/6-carboxytetrahydropterin synthase